MLVALGEQAENHETLLVREEAEYLGDALRAFSGGDGRNEVEIGFAVPYRLTEGDSSRTTRDLIVNEPLTPLSHHCCILSKHRNNLSS